MTSPLPPVAALATFNVWLLPFISPLFLSRGADCARWLSTFVHTNSSPRRSQQHQHAAGSNQQQRLAVVGFQEAWGFRAGLMWPILWLISVIERAASWLCCCMTVSWCWRRCGREKAVGHPLLGNDPSNLAAALSQVLTAWWMPCVMWDPKTAISAAMAKSDCFGPALGRMKYTIGLGGMSLPSLSTSLCKQRLIDSGLMISANLPPVDSGFESFVDYHGGEQTSHKGVLWGYWEVGADTGSSRTQRHGVLVLNTHMTGAGRRKSLVNPELESVETAQLRQFADLIRRLHRSFSTRRACATTEVYCLGDFNFQMHEPLFRNWLAELGLNRLSTDNGPTSDGGKTIDHIFTTARGLTVHQPEPEPTATSDHFVVAVLDLQQAGGPLAAAGAAGAAALDQPHSTPFDGAIREAQRAVRSKEFKK